MKNTPNPVTILGEPAQRIPDAHQMPPFLMHLITDSDVWAFIGSQGAITAGRKNSDNAIFPYATQDKLFDAASVSGSFTTIQYRADGGDNKAWRVHRDSCAGDVEVKNAVEKSLTGSRITLESENASLGLKVRITWTSSRRYGLLRHISVENLSGIEQTFVLTDGIQNILPANVSAQFQTEFSNLADAYKVSERISDRAALYALNSLPTDRASPNEALTATVAWSCGFEQAKVGLFVPAVDEGMPVGRGQEIGEMVRGRRGAYLLEGELTLSAGARHEHWITANPRLDAGEILTLLNDIEQAENLPERLEKEADQVTRTIRSWVGALDGIQRTRCFVSDQRHFSNTLFNMMRGGTFPHGYNIPMVQLRDHIRQCNMPVYRKHEAFLNGLPEVMPLATCRETMAGRGDPDLMRLAGEYLPLVFSRRHGDPSRPWNRFEVNVHQEGGGYRFAYQGNWRDIFQNWEATLLAFPRFTSAAIHRFLNATTACGYNPYRITTHFFEWERPEPDSPWSNIGYWGDHQIIYLLKLLEAQEKLDPRALSDELNAQSFVYAQIPYKMKGATAIRKNPRDTIIYDEALSETLDKRVEAIGWDGRLLHDAGGNRVYGTLLDKLLTPLLEKLTHFVPDAGIWMNTQRPEWNDANNALVGYGASVVTLGYMHRYLRFLIRLLGQSGLAELQVRKDQARLLEHMASIFKPFSDEGRGMASPDRRAAISNSLGELGAAHRERVYSLGPVAERELQSCESVTAQLEAITRAVARSLWSNQREDGLFHSYNLIHWQGNEAIEVDRLPLMLEGQVSILSAQLLDAAASLRILDALERSELYREDQDSYMLYPDRKLTSFLQKGAIPQSVLEAEPALGHIFKKTGDKLLSRGPDERIRFRPHLNNPENLEAALDALDLDPHERMAVEAAYEATFYHRSFTGRSGSFFAYEGLGSIYWHMVSKLVLAVQENAKEAYSHDQPEASTAGDRLRHFYIRLREGIGIHKSPKVYGAFPTDPYSHTPAHAGAQQPGMTGQVKEDILSRLGEFGVRLEAGAFRIQPDLLSEAAFLDQPSKLDLIGLDGEAVELELHTGELAFTLCQVPVVYRLVPDADPRITIQTRDGETITDSLKLPPAESASLMDREGRISKLIIEFAPELLKARGESEPVATPLAL